MIQHSQHALLQNLAAISADFHTHKLYSDFYETFGQHINGFVGMYDICIDMAQALTDWENDNGDTIPYDSLPWIEIIERYVADIIEISILTGEIPNARVILRQLMTANKS